MKVDAWSKSSLNSLLDGCSWQWALRKVYKLDDHGSPATAMGTGYHKAIEEWENSQRSLSLEEMQAVAAEKSYEECKLLPMSQWFEHSTDPAQVVELAQESVRLWWEQPINKGATLREIAESRELISVEQYFNDELQSYGIHGFTDGIYSDGRQMYVVDHKTASSMRRWTYERKPSIEVAMYLVLARKAMESGALPEMPVSFEYQIASAKEGKTRLIDCGYMNDELEALLVKALSDATAITEHEAFRPKPDWNLCSPKYCSYFEGCRGDGTLSPYRLTTSNVPEAASPTQ
jgi:hypothetical protein